jgi:uncharacterized protein DUF6893
MNEITIGSGVQKLVLLALLALAAMLFATQLPEIQRYLKIRSM